MSSPIVILVPGAQAPAREQFAGLKPLLARDLDVRGADLAAEPAGGLEADAAAVKEAIDAAPGPVALLGYHYGAHVALAAASGNGKVTELALVGGWLATDDYQREGIDLWLDLFDTDPLLAARARLHAGLSATFRGFQSQLQTAADLTPKAPTAHERERVAALRDVDHTELARAVTARALVVAGGHDTIAPPPATRRLVGALPEAELATFDAGHDLLIERIGQVYGAFADFLARRPAGAASVDTLVP